MSFSENPYKSMTIINIGLGDDTLSRYKWECSSCGGESKELFNADTPLGEVRLSFSSHVANSHKLTREETRSW